MKEAIVMRFDISLGTVGTKEEIPLLDILKVEKPIEVVDEMALYQQLSKQLSELEVTVDYTASQVKPIQEKVKKIMINLDEKEELFLRCEWLVTMKEIEGQLDELTTLEAGKVNRAKLERIQTCPLKKELLQKLEALEIKLMPVEKQLSMKEALVEAIFATRNETFINLGSAGRDYVVEEVLTGNGKVETVIAKAEELEAKVQSIKNIKSIDELRQTLLGLPLQYFSAIPSEYEEEVLQFLIENPNWNGLFQLDLQIKQFTSQLDCKYNQELEDVQEDIYQTVVLNEKLMEQLGVKQL